jgi:hypothetical protein
MVGLHGILVLSNIIFAEEAHLCLAGGGLGTSNIRYITTYVANRGEIIHPLAGSPHTWSAFGIVMQVKTGTGRIFSGDGVS